MNLIKGLVFGWTCFVSGLNISLASDSQEEKVLEIFDGVCVQSRGDLSLFENVAEGLGGKDVSEQVKDPSILENGGKSYFIPYDGEDYLAGFVVDGGCSIGINRVDPALLTHLIEERFPISSGSLVDETATQVSQAFLIGKDAGILEGAMVMLTYAKPSTGWNTASISFVWPRSRSVSLADGSTYVGEVVNGSPMGEGVITYPNGDKYEGRVKNGLPDGMGTYSFAVGHKYQGEHRSGKSYGHGTFSWADGRRYKGEWLDDKQHGEGTYSLSDGRSFHGQFQYGKIHGEGTFMFPDGRKVVGTWRNNQPWNAKMYSGSGMLVRTYRNGV